MTEIRKCPFCGGKSHIAIAIGDRGVGYSVICDNLECPVHKAKIHHSKEEAITDWNTRTPDIELIRGDIQAMYEQAMYDLLLTDKIPNPYLYGKKDMLERVLSLLETEESK